MTDMSQRSPLSTLAKDTMNVNTTSYNPNRIGSGYRQPETVINNVLVEQPIATTPVVTQVTTPVATSTETIIVQKGTQSYGVWMNYLFWFVIIAIIAWFLLVSLRPEIVLKHHHHHEHRDHHERSEHERSDCNERSDHNRSECGDEHHHDHHRHRELDYARVLVASIIIALIAIFIIWIFQWGCSSRVF